MKSATFSSLSIRNYRLFASGMVVSNTGIWMQRIAQDWLVVSLTGSGTDLGVVTALQFGPALTFSLWGGALADRYRKNRLLMLTATLTGLCALTLGLLIVSGAVELWHVYLIALVGGTVTAFDNPARQSFVVELVGPEALPNAVALNAATFNLARMLGPALASLALAVMDVGWVFIANAMAGVAIITGLALIRADELHAPIPIVRAKGQYREAFVYLRTRPDLLAVLFCMFFLATFGLNFQITSTLMAVQTFHLGKGTFGLLNILLALGALSGALVTARRRRVGVALVLLSACGFGVAAMVVSVMPDPVLYGALMLPVGVMIIMVTTSANATMQTGVEPEMRGRVMSVYMVVFLGGTPIGSPLVGWIGQHFGARYAVGGGGLISIVAAVAAAYALARVKGVSVRERLAAHTPPRLAERLAA
ncbi:MFS transporter [Catenulispora subtropica]|uniref:MFS transporter n=1 Tax=Catenulispora subtropica TaxID=450798 RepID=A0ABP5DAZ6_9ACTN